MLPQSNTVVVFLTNCVKYSLLQELGGNLSEFKLYSRLNKLRMNVKCDFGVCETAPWLFHDSNMIQHRSKSIRENN